MGVWVSSPWHAVPSHRPISAASVLTKRIVLRAHLRKPTDSRNGDSAAARQRGAPNGDLFRNACSGDGRGQTRKCRRGLGHGSGVGIESGLGTGGPNFSRLAQTTELHLWPERGDDAQSPLPRRRRDAQSEHDGTWLVQYHP